MVQKRFHAQGSYRGQVASVPHCRSSAVQTPDVFTPGAQTPAKLHNQLGKCGLFCQGRAEEEEMKISHCSVSQAAPEMQRVQCCKSVMAWSFDKTQVPSASSCFHGSWKPPTALESHLVSWALKGFTCAASHPGQDGEGRTSDWREIKL